MVVAVDEHPIFVRTEFDVQMESAPDIVQAALGASVRIPTIDGKEELLDIPAGTQTGKVFRKRGDGIPKLQRQGAWRHADYSARCYPTDLNPEQRNLLQQLAKMFGHERSAQQRFF